MARAAGVCLVRCIVLVFACYCQIGMSIAAVINIKLADLPKSFDEDDANPVMISITDAIWNNPNGVGDGQIRLYDDPGQTQLSDIIVFNQHDICFASDQDAGDATGCALLALKDFDLKITEDGNPVVQDIGIAILDAQQNVVDHGTLRVTITNDLDPAPPGPGGSIKIERLPEPNTQPLLAIGIIITGLAYRLRICPRR